MNCETVSGKKGQFLSNKCDFVVSLAPLFGGITADDGEVVGGLVAADVALDLDVGVSQRVGGPVGHGGVVAVGGGGGGAQREGCGDRDGKQRPDQRTT